MIRDLIYALGAAALVIASVLVLYPVEAGADRVPPSPWCVYHPPRVCVARGDG